MRYLLLGLIVFTLQNCASITRGSTQSFTVTSEPSGADIRFSNGFACVTPCTIVIDRRPGFSVTASKEGYRTITTSVESRVRGGGGAAVAGNVLAGGIVGIGVDSLTGAMNDLEPNPLFITLPEED